MKKTLSWLLAMLLLVPSLALAQAPISLEGLSVQELEAQRREADARIRLAALPDKQGYLEVTDGEAYAREPQNHLNEKIHVSGSILAAKGTAPGFEYALSLDSNPARVFQVRYTLAADERLLLPGDRVTAYGVFQGLNDFTGTLALTDGAPILQADLVIHQLANENPPQSAGTRQQPVPLGVEAKYAGSWWTDYATFAITALSASRGSQALKLARDMSKYNITPLRAQEYFIVSVRVKALAAPRGRAPIKQEDFVFVSAKGIEYRQHFLLNPPTTLSPMYEGAEQTVSLACLIDKGDTPLMVYLPESQTPLWFDPNR